MGMYTELLLRVELEEEIPQDVEEVLQFLFNDGNPPDHLPNHEFFKCDRWSYIGRSCSYYHVPFVTNQYEKGHIFSRSDLKNYDNEIEKFINWLKPYLRVHDGYCIGWSWHEESDVPVLLIM